MQDQLIFNSRSFIARWSQTGSSKQFGIRGSELCDNCNEIVTISHLLFECRHSQKIWNDVTRWLEHISPNEINTDKKSIMLGNNRNELIINNVIIIIKHEIYKRKWNKTKVGLFKLKKNHKIPYEFRDMNCNYKK